MPVPRTFQSVLGVLSAPVGESVHGQAREDYRDVHGAVGREELLLPEIERQQKQGQPLVRYKSFLYQAASWKKARRLVKHARYYWSMLAESHLTRRLFGSKVRRRRATKPGEGGS